MQIKIGDRIKELRKRDGRTQEELAANLGVTSQAVSRWEASGGYPDMEIIPSIAGYFGVSIDALFGYDGIDRKKRIDSILSEVEKMKNRCAPSPEITAVLRNAVSEFPGEERILFELANSLYKQGWSDRSARGYTTDEDEYSHNDGEWNKDNPFWQESINISTNLLETSRDSNILMVSRQNLVYLYRNIGQYDKAVEFAEAFPDICISKQIMLYHGTDGEQSCKYAQYALMDLLSELSAVVTRILVLRHPIKREDYLSDNLRRIEKISGVLKLFESIYDDGNMGFYHTTVCDTYLWLAVLYCDAYCNTGGDNGGEIGYKDLSFDCLDKALFHAKKFDKLIGTGEHKYTAFLVNLSVTDTDKWSAIPISGNIMNHVQLFDHVKKILMQDDRWQMWIDKITQV